MSLRSVYLVCAAVCGATASLRGDTYNLNHPGDVIIVSDTGNQRVIMIDTNGTVVWTTDGLGLGLSYPNDANHLANGNVLITDRDADGDVDLADAAQFLANYACP